MLIVLHWQYELDGQMWELPIPVPLCDKSASSDVRHLGKYCPECSPPWQRTCEQIVSGQQGVIVEGCSCNERCFRFRSSYPGQAFIWEHSSRRNARYLKFARFPELGVPAEHCSWTSAWHFHLSHHLSSDTSSSTSSSGFRQQQHLSIDKRGWDLSQIW